MQNDELGDLEEAANLGRALGLVLAVAIATGFLLWSIRMLWLYVTGTPE